MLCKSFCYHANCYNNISCFYVEDRLLLGFLWHFWCIYIIIYTCTFVVFFKRSGNIFADHLCLLWFFRALNGQKSRWIVCSSSDSSKDSADSLVMASCHDQLYPFCLNLLYVYQICWSDLHVHVIVLHWFTYAHHSWLCCVTDLVCKPATCCHSAVHRGICNMVLHVRCYYPMCMLKG